MSETEQARIKRIVADQFDVPEEAVNVEKKDNEG